MIWEIDDGTTAIEGLDEHGRPNPRYAAALGLRPALPGSRVLAAVSDWVFALVLAVPGMFALVPVAIDVFASGVEGAALMTRPDLVWIIVGYAASTVLLLVYTLVQLILMGRRGVTLGKAFFGIRAINVRTLERPKFWRGAVVRYLLAYASLLLPLVGPVVVIALSPLFDSEKRGRGWLDRASATWMVDVRRGLNPYDQKRMRIARKAQRISEHEQKAPLPSLATPVDRNAPAQYVPSGRLSGGVVGAHRQTPTQAAVPTTPPAQPSTLRPSSAQPARPAPVPPVLPISEGMVSAVPGLRAAADVSAPEAPAPPTSAPPTRRQAEAVASKAPAPAPADDPQPQAPRAVLILDSGRRIEVRATTLFGRAPAAAAGEGAVQLIQVEDDTRSISKTHLAVMLGRRGLVVVDRASTNGSSVIRGGAETVLVPGQPVALLDGDTVQFGDRSMRVQLA